MTDWKKAKKKPVVIEFREVQPNSMTDSGPAEQIHTREGFLFGYKGKDFIIRGIEGEVYPIKKDIFYKTHDVIE